MRCSNVVLGPGSNEQRGWLEGHTHKQSEAVSMRKEQVSIPGAKRAEIVDYIRANAATYFHFVGTCAMGKDTSAPVDELLRVRGVSRLRVADASVMPEMPSVDTNLPTIVVAERLAAWLRED